MKKLFILITLILFKNVVSQNNNLQQNKKQFNTPSISNARLAGQSYQQTQSLIALYDSIYKWHLDTATMQWIYTNKTINIIYNPQQYQTSYLNQKWNGTTWENALLDSNTYNAYNEITNQVQLKWNGTNWIDSIQISTTYDTSNNPTLLHQKWNGSVWVNSDLDAFTFDNYHNMTSANTYTWNSTTWVKTETLIHTFNYNTNNHITTDNWQVWIPPSGGPPPFLDTYTYNSFNYVTTHLSQVYYSGTGWVNQSYTVCSYNNNTKLDSETVQIWHSSGGSSGYWVPSSLNVYTYDGNSNRLTNLGQTYTGALWTNNYLYTYTYDANNLEKSYTYKKFNNTGVKVTSGDSTIYYFNAVTAIKQIKTNSEQINIYPNPSTGSFTIQTNTTTKQNISVFDVNGKLVLLQTINGNTNIDASNFNAGVYNISITSNEGVTNKRLVIVK